MNEVSMDATGLLVSAGSEDGFGLLESSLMQVERSRPDGLTSAEILDLLGTHGVAVSEATLRKYVQLGLLPRSVRVGRKGKHLGSRGLYPAEVVRRIVFIKALMAERYTIEEIRRRLVFLSVDIDKLEAGIRGVLAKIRESRESGEGEGRTSVSAIRGHTGPRGELRAIERLARELIERLRKLDQELSQRAANGDREIEAGSALRRVV